MRDYSAYSPSQLVDDGVRRTFYFDPDLIVACCRRREEVAPLLLDWVKNELNSVLPEHEDLSEPAGIAVLLLAEWREPKALRIYEGILRDQQLADRMAQEPLMDAVISYGRSAVPMLTAIVLDPDAPLEWGRGCASGMLAGIARLDPTTRDEIARTLRSILPSVGADGRIDLPVPAPDVSRAHRHFWTHIVSDLARLDDRDSYSQVMTLYRDGLLEEEQIGPDGYEAILLSGMYRYGPIRPGLSKHTHSTLGFMLKHVLVRVDVVRKAIERSGTAPAGVDALVARHRSAGCDPDEAPLRGYYEWLHQVEASDAERSIRASRLPITTSDLFAN